MARIRVHWSNKMAWSLNCEQNQKCPTSTRFTNTCNGIQFQQWAWCISIEIRCIRMSRLAIPIHLFHSNDTSKNRRIDSFLSSSLRSDAFYLSDLTLTCFPIRLVANVSVAATDPLTQDELCVSWALFVAHSGDRSLSFTRNTKHNQNLWPSYIADFCCVLKCALHFVVFLF